MSLSTTVKVLMVVGAIYGLISTSCFLRMIVQLNRALPAEKRIPLWKLREDFFEIGVCMRTRSRLVAFGRRGLYLW